jgi:hypothetical protein
VVAAVREPGDEDGLAAVGEVLCPLLYVFIYFYFYWADMWAFHQSGALFSIFFDIYDF